MFLYFLPSLDESEIYEMYQLLGCDFLIQSISTRSSVGKILCQETIRV